MLLFSNMPTITYFLRSNNDKAKSFVLYCRVKVNGTTAEFSTKEKVEPLSFNQTSQRFIGKNERVRFLNSLLESISYKIKTTAIHHDDELTAKQLIETATKPKKEKHSLIEIIELYIKDLEQSENFAFGTIRNHRIKLANLLEYSQISKQTFTALSFDPVEAERFREWFIRKNRTTNVTTATRNVLFFKNACSWAVKKGMIKHFALLAYKGEKDGIKAPIYLDGSEFIKIRNHRFQSSMLQRACDLLIFQCVTGLSYGDIWSNLEPVERNGQFVLIGSRAKNGQSFFIPFSAIAEELLEKYDWQLPRFSNAVYNRCLKEIASMLAINKRISSHTGRKTFATLQDSAGWSRESIAMMLGHKSVKTTELYYIGQSFARIENEMLLRAGKAKND